VWDFVCSSARKANLGSPILGLHSPRMMTALHEGSVQYGRHVDFVLPTSYHVRCTLMMASLMAVDPLTESSINPSHDFTAFIGHPQSA
jgi:hypothetical protein